MEKYIICAYSAYGRLDIVHEFWAEDWEDAMVKSIDFALHTEREFDSLYIYGIEGIINSTRDGGVKLA